MLLPGEADGDLIEVPFVATARRSPTDPVGEFPAEFEAPLPDRLVRHPDAAGGPPLLDQAEAQREPKIQPDRVELRCALFSAGTPTMTAASSPSVSWSCSPPKPAMLGCSTPATGSRQGWLETGRANRSSSRKPIPRSRSVGRAAIASRDQRSFTRIRIPAGSPPSSATLLISSARSLDRKISNIFG